VIDEDKLQRLYIAEQRSIRDIAAIEHVSTRSIYDALIYYCIPRRPSGFRAKAALPGNPLLDEQTLRQLYLVEQHTIRDIATLSGVSTRVVYDALCRYRIPRRAARQPRPASAVITFGSSVLDKPTLQRLYHEEGQSIAAIAASMSCAPSRIRNALVRWDIARRRRGRRNDSQTSAEARITH